MKIALMWIAGLIILFALIFCLNAYNMATFTFFAPKYENARRKVFDNTNSYVRGKISDLSNLKQQYEMAKDSADKQVFKSAIKQQFSDFDASQLPDGLQSFLYQVRGY